MSLDIATKVGVETTLEERIVLEVEGPTTQILPGQCLPTRECKGGSIHPYTIRMFTILCLENKLVLNAQTLAELDQDLGTHALEDLPGPSSLQAFRGPGHTYGTPGLHYGGSAYKSQHSVRDIQPLRIGDAQALLQGRIADPKWRLPILAVEDKNGALSYNPEDKEEVRLKPVDIPVLLLDADVLGYDTELAVVCKWSGRSYQALEHYQDRRLFLCRPGLVCKHHLTHDEFQESGEDYTYGVPGRQRPIDIQNWLLGVEPPRIRCPGRTAHSCSYEKITL